jgi:hypothetical protein
LRASPIHVSYLSFLRSDLWKIKIPLKIKVFLWLLYREVILIKDNLVKRNWHKNEMCSFCSNKEIIQHLYFDCALANFIWRVVHLVARPSLPNNIRHMFGAWVRDMNSNDRHFSSCWCKRHVVDDMIKL